MDKQLRETLKELVEHFQTAKGHASAEVFCYQQQAFVWGILPYGTDKLLQDIQARLLLEQGE
jgi:hypothetical protein